jgi:MFS family permease
VLAYVSVSGLGGFYAVAAVAGFIYAGTMPLYAVLIRENFPLSMMGTLIGASAMAGSLGMSTGPLLGGWIYDRLDSYAPMYAGSAGLGLVAMLILMAFRPFSGRGDALARAG